jgi:hypothetical protein
MTILKFVLEFEATSISESLKIWQTSSEPKSSSVSHGQNGDDRRGLHNHELPCRSETLLVCRRISSVVNGMANLLSQNEA